MTATLLKREHFVRLIKGRRKIFKIEVSNQQKRTVSLEESFTLSLEHVHRLSAEGTVVRLPSVFTCRKRLLSFPYSKAWQRCVHNDHLADETFPH